MDLHKHKRLSNRFVFCVALKDAFREEEERELYAAGNVELNEGSANETIMDMFYAFQVVFNEITDSNVDPLEFLSILTRLLFQDKLGDTGSEDTVPILDNFFNDDVP